MSICVDLWCLNECVHCEVYQLPKVDDLLAQLAGARVFSKLDAQLWILANSFSSWVKTFDNIFDTNG